MVCNCCRKIGNFGSEARLRGFVCCVWMVSAKVLVSRRIFCCCCSRADRCLTLVLSFCWAMDCDFGYVFDDSSHFVLGFSECVENLLLFFVHFCLVSGRSDLRKPFRYEKITRKDTRKKEKKILGFLTWLVSDNRLRSLCRRYLRFLAKAD